MLIGIDIDDTIANSYDSFLKWALEYDKSLRNTGMLSKNRAYHDDFDWTKEEIDDFYGIYFEKCFGGVIPKTDAMETISRLIKEGHSIAYITSRNNMNTKYSAYDITMEWMKKHNVPYGKVITESIDKKAVCVREGVNVFIDDSVDQCTNVASQNDITVILYDEFDRRKEYNKSLKVKSWDEIYSIISKLV